MASYLKNFGFARKSGILMPVSSLPSPYGIGSLGKPATDFVDFLAATGQTCWQILPLSPTSYGDSPYQSPASAAGNPYFIDLPLLRETGLLTEEELRQARHDTLRVDYGWLFQTRFSLLRTAFSRFRPNDGYRDFCRLQQHWLEDYALFMALKLHHGYRPWVFWEPKYRDITQARRHAGDFREEMDFWRWVQFTFRSQWDAVHAYAGAKGIFIIGDIPIYAAHDSVDVWQAPENFLLDPSGQPVVVAGFPPDNFSPDGQLWGNPIYNWEHMTQNGFRWWIHRIRSCFQLYDILRIDHFIGFESYYAVPYPSPTAAGGKWHKAPGNALFRAVLSALPESRIIAEDLGIVTEEVRRLLAFTGFPGMKMLHFAFYEDNSENLPRMYGSDNWVVYTASHDSDCTYSWAKGLDKAALTRFRKECPVKPGQTRVQALIALAMGSRANLVMVPMQDYLELDNASGRMNVPSVAQGNWSWRLQAGYATPKLIKKSHASPQLAVGVPCNIGKSPPVPLHSGAPNQHIPNNGGQILTQLKEITVAGMLDFNTVQYGVSSNIRITSLDRVQICQGNRSLPIQSVSTLNQAADCGSIVLAERLDITKPYELEIEGFARKTVIPTKLFDSAEFLKTYTYSGDDLGAVIQGSNTTFKVWAPTAGKVVLNLFAAGNDCKAFANAKMTYAGNGVWEHTQENCGHGTYYTYTVTTAVGAQEATDPYAKAAGVNGERSMVVDLSRTDPAGWGKPFDPGIGAYSEAVIWEVHVRDFSNRISASKYPGKYLAFTERGLKNKAGIPVGVDHLVDLGITHVHLLPVYDYATVDETQLDVPQFNWGYDPKNYNVPEGSYSTDPYRGEVRILEYKQMVQALHSAGLGVIMDMVYNHTYDANSAFNKIVPYYYYRYTASGVNTNASGCGNDTASERFMFRKFMVDSVRYWASEYALDGFRFDLMGLHDLQTMQEIEAAVHAVNPKALIYGEGWTMGTTGDGSLQANQTNISKIKPSHGGIGGIAVFNDAIRDGLKGSTFEKLSLGFISGAYGENLLKIKFGIAGSELIGIGWTVKNKMTVNYMSAHDNHTLWDKLALSNPSCSTEERMAMNRLGAGIIMVSQGTPFMQAGEEMLRSKEGDENSYRSSDGVNNIRWETLTPTSGEYSMMTYYRGLIAMRKAYPILGTDGSVAVTFSDLTSGGLAVHYEAANGEQATVLINPTPQTFSYRLNGQWALVTDGTRAGADVLEVESGTVDVPGYSLRVYVQN